MWATTNKPRKKKKENPKSNEFQNEKSFSTDDNLLTKGPAKADDYRIPKWLFMLTQ